VDAPDIEVRFVVERNGEPISTKPAAGVYGQSPALL
jgi:hypothetical protein